MKVLSMALLGLVCLTGAGCFSRAHMSENYGRANKQAFTRQAVTPGVATAKSPKGLDALEAGIVVETYRTQLSPKAANVPDQQMILLSPQAGSLGYTPSGAAAAPK
jgi:hypothetical protein